VRGRLCGEGYGAGLLSAQAYGFKQYGDHHESRCKSADSSVFPLVRGWRVVNCALHAPLKSC